MDFSIFIDIQGGSPTPTPRRRDRQEPKELVFKPLPDTSLRVLKTPVQQVRREGWDPIPFPFDLFSKKDTPSFIRTHDEGSFEGQAPSPLPLSLPPPVFSSSPQYEEASEDEDDQDDEDDTEWQTKYLPSMFPPNQRRKSLSLQEIASMPNLWVIHWDLDNIEWIYPKGHARHEEILRACKRGRTRQLTPGTYAWHDEDGTERVSHVETPPLIRHWRNPATFPSYVEVPPGHVWCSPVSVIRDPDDDAILPPDDVYTMAIFDPEATIAQLPDDYRFWWRDEGREWTVCIFSPPDLTLATAPTPDLSHLDLSHLHLEDEVDTDDTESDAAGEEDYDGGDEDRDGHESDEPESEVDTTELRGGQDD